VSANSSADIPTGCPGSQARATVLEGSRQSQSASPPARTPEQSGPRKLSYRERRELDALPAKIAVLEAEHRQLEATIAGPDFYKAGPSEIDAILARVGVLEQALLDAYMKLDGLKARE
jgi:ATP-binding cassette subfamily F protein uup